MILKHMGIDSGKNSRPFFFFADRRNVPLSSKEFAEGLNILDQLTLFTEPSAPPNLAAQTPPFSLFFSLQKLCMYLFIWLHQVFVAACGIFRYNAWTLYLQHMGSRVCGLQQFWDRDSSCGMWTLECTGSGIAAHDLRCSEACGILFSWPGIESECPALQGGFLTAGSPEMSQHTLSLSCCF